MDPRYWWPDYSKNKSSRNEIFSIRGLGMKFKKVQQLERLRSEDIPCRLMIAHTIDSYWILSQNKTKSKLQI